MACPMLLQCSEDYIVIAFYYDSFHNWSSAVLKKKTPPTKTLSNCCPTYRLLCLSQQSHVHHTSSCCIALRVSLPPRDPAGPAGEEAAQSVEHQEGPQALAAPLHPGQQSVPGGHPQALPASDGGELCERKPPPQRQGGECKAGNDQGSGGVTRQLKLEWKLQTKKVSLSALTVKARGIGPNKCTYGALSHVRMFN